MHLHPRTLTGTHIRLEPVTPAHREAMRAALDCDQANWDIQVVSARAEHFAAYWDALRQAQDLHAPGRIAFAVRDIGSGSPGEGRLAGTSSFLFVNPQHATCEIGSTWFRPEYRGGVVNPEAKLLMLGEAFAAEAERVTFRVDARNARSQAAMARLGAVREGVARHDFVTWTGHRRSSVVFSIIADQWRHVREGLEARLAVR